MVPGSIFMLKPPYTHVVVIDIESVERALDEDYCFASGSAANAYGRRRVEIAAMTREARAAVERARASADPGKAKADRVHELLEKAKP